MTCFLGRTALKKYLLITLQIITVGICFLLFYFIGKLFSPLNSFILSFLSYWIILVVISIVYILNDESVNKHLKTLFLTFKRKPLVLINFIPVLTVFIVAFKPIIPNVHIKVFSFVLLISIFNGFIEEIYWRGLVLSKYTESNILIIIPTILFSIFHFAFLLLPLNYHGGAINLVGGAAFMGFIWLFISKYTKNILFSIIAHILVNFFAFSGLFISNNLI